MNYCKFMTSTFKLRFLKKTTTKIPEVNLFQMLDSGSVIFVMCFPFFFTYIASLISHQDSMGFSLPKTATLRGVKLQQRQPPVPWFHATGCSRWVRFNEKSLA